MKPQEMPIDLPSTVAPPTPGDGPQLVLRPEDYPNVENLITEDGAPVDSVYAEKQQRLLTHTLYASWQPAEEDQRFVAFSNVGLFPTTERPPLVPDCLVSLGVQFPHDIRRKEHHSYFPWLYGKMPNVVIEIVSDRRGGEEDYKMSEYARMPVPYYVIYDPNNLLAGGELRVMELRHRRYRKMADGWLEGIGLGLKLWQGVYEEVEETWLRWCDREGNVIPTGCESREREKQRADQEKQRADQEKQRADQEKQRADQEKQRADDASVHIKRLEAQLRERGTEPSA